MHYRVRYLLEFDPKIRSGQVCLQKLYYLSQGTGGKKTSFNNIDRKIKLYKSRNFIAQLKAQTSQLPVNTSAANLAAG